MSIVGKAIAFATTRLPSWFMPASADREQPFDHAHILLVSIVLITSAFSLLYVAVSYVISYDIGMALMFLCFLLLLAVLAIFRTVGNYRLCANLYLACCFFVAVLGCSFYSGGIRSMVLPWFTLVPLVSVLFTGSGRDTTVWTALTCATVFAFGLAGMLGFRFPIRYDTAYTDFFNIMCIAGLVVLLSLFAYIFGWNRQQAMATIHAQKVDLERALAEIEHLAFHDALTLLPNRRLFLDRLGHALAESRRNGCYGALMFLDLDHFKPLNDTYGHEAGDQLLVHAAGRLTRCTREMDTVARLGGDEFAVILNALGKDEAGSRAGASVVAEKVAAALAEPYPLRARSQDGTVGAILHRCTASIGVALFCDHDTTPDQLLHLADEAMYRAKSSGKNAIRFHSAEAADRTAA